MRLPPDIAAFTVIVAVVASAVTLLLAGSLSENSARAPEVTCPVTTGEILR